MLHLLLILFIAAAPGASALALGPGTYAISAVGDNLCLGYYLAYDTKSATTDVYLVPSNTSQPPLWNVNPAPGGAGFQLTPVTRPFRTSEMLAYDRLSCSKTAVSLNSNPNSTWVNAGGFLNAAARGECPPGSAVTLAPLKTTGAGRCRAVGLVPAIIQPDPAAAMWHFTKYPASPVELYTKSYGTITDWASSIVMDDTLLVAGASFRTPEPTYWQRDVGGVWRRGNIKLKLTDNFNYAVAMGDGFVAVAVPKLESKSIWRVLVYDKANLGGGPIATLTAADAIYPAVSIAAGGNNLAVAEDKTFVFSRNKAGKWGAPMRLATSGSAWAVHMSHDGRTLALGVAGKRDDQNQAISSGRALVFRQAKASGPWVKEADIRPPASLGIQPDGPLMALNPGGDTLAVAFQTSPTKMRIFFYSRNAKGVWALEQSSAAPGNIYRMALDADTMVALMSNRIYDASPNDCYLYRRSKATGKWVRGRRRPLPRWDDDFTQDQGPNSGVSTQDYGEIALVGKRLAITASFSKNSRYSPGVTFIYDNVDDL